PGIQASATRALPQSMRLPATWTMTIPRPPARSMWTRTNKKGLPGYRNRTGPFLAPMGRSWRRLRPKAPAYLSVVSQKSMSAWYFDACVVADAPGVKLIVSPDVLKDPRMPTWALMAFALFPQYAAL